MDKTTEKLGRRGFVVKELIEILKTMPQNDEVVIVDADTGYILPLSYAGKDETFIRESAYRPANFTDGDYTFLVGDFDNFIEKE